ncbi:MAG: isoprenoid biosynthesis protein ElbB, partial [Desulfuromonadaceae bacterium]|nr:isoprenoid biosynthesis protein ElbB [Desulfuromonadaceae bacterium]
AGKPLAGICIAPAMLAKILGPQQPPVTLTIGTDQDTAATLDTMGVQHVACPVDDVVVDTQRKIVTTPAYMLADNIAQVAVGIEKAIQRMLKLR